MVGGYHHHQDTCRAPLPPRFMKHRACVMRRQARGRSAQPGVQTRGAIRKTPSNRGEMGWLGTGRGAETHRRAGGPVRIRGGVQHTGGVGTARLIITRAQVAHAYGVAHAHSKALRPTERGRRQRGSSTGTRRCPLPRRFPPRRSALARARLRTPLTGTRVKRGPMANRRCQVAARNTEVCKRGRLKAIARMGRPWVHDLGS
jgi:hypothetical protein